MKIKINDREYGLQWGMGAIEIYLERMDCDIDGLELITTPGKQQLKAIVILIMAALQNYAELYNEPFDISYRQLQATLTDLPQTEYDAIIEDWKASKYFGKTISQYLFGDTSVTDTSKKKPRSVKS